MSNEGKKLIQVLRVGGVVALLFFFGFKTITDRVAPHDPASEMLASHEAMQQAGHVYRTQHAGSQHVVSSRSGFTASPVQHAAGELAAIQFDAIARYMVRQHYLKRCQEEGECPPTATIVSIKPTTAE